MSPSPVTEWINKAKDGSPSAYDALWNHYFEKLVRLARARMFALQGAFYDEEDAALSAINSLFRGLHAGRFPELHGRDNLWRLLVVITHRKLRAQWRRQSADKRNPDRETDQLNIQNIICEEPTADFVTEMMDQTESMIKSLEDETLQRIAVLRLDGMTYDEIAERLGCATRTVLRKVERIRRIWDELDA